jgi:riboflavin kinase / FMN adenylyltransferase
MIIFDGNLLDIVFQKSAMALTMGVFDGVHRGHVDLIHQLTQVAKEKNLKPAVMSFYPHPNHIIDEKTEPELLLTKSERIEHLKRLGLDFLFLQDFSVEFSKLDRKDFLRQYLLDYLEPQYLLFGYDFKFGNHGAGNYEYAKAELKICEVEKSNPTFYGSHVISSSLIRNFLKKGNLKDANQCLGYNYKISGKVSSGLKIGRTLGFPTANLSEIQTIIPGSSVYCGYASIAGKKYKAVMNIGVRPTIQKNNELSCECHILDFNKDIYGQWIEFEFIDVIRNEIKFANLNDLKKQIDVDIKMTKMKLEKHESGS